MEWNKLRIDGIPAVLWGKETGMIILAAHGSHSSKIDDCICVLAREAVRRGYQVLSFDLPRHGERVYETAPLMPDECVRELRGMYAYAAARARTISLFGCSMGAYFELLAFAKAELERVWFLSPVTDMERIIRNLMAYCQVTEETFRERVSIDNDIEPLYYPYFDYVRRHPVTEWPHDTRILRGENDTMCELPRVQDFAARFGCELTEQKGGEHWFHTEEQLAFFGNWIGERLE